MTSSFVTIGESMALLSSSGTGPLRHGGQLNVTMAGSESNVAIGLSRLGVSTAWIGRVGRDEFGELIARELRAENIDARVTIDEAPTGLMFKERRTANVTRVIYYRSGSAGGNLSPDDVDEGLVRGARVLHVTGITLALGEAPAAALRAAVEIARENGVLVSFDINYRAALWSASAARASMLDLLPLVDIVFAGTEEVRLLLDVGQVHEALHGLERLGPRQVLLKHGAAGASALVDGVERTIQPKVVATIDPVGAGDAFAAGYLYGLLGNLPLAERLETAATMGAFAVGVRGDWQGLPLLRELELLKVVDTVVR